MKARDNDPLHEPINAKLAEVVAGLSTPPAWFDGWTGLGPDSTEEARLAVYRAVRDSGLLPEEAGFYLVSWQIDAMTSLDAETTLRDLDDRMKAIEGAHGLEEGELWPPDSPWTWRSCGPSLTRSPPAPGNRSAIRTAKVPT